MSSGPGDFWASLPSDLTPKEEQLADAVVDFLRSWAADEAKKGKSPNLIHLGADKRIRECKSQAVPPEVALRAWLERRLSSKVTMVKTSVQLISSAS